MNSEYHKIRNFNSKIQKAVLMGQKELKLPITELTDLSSELISLLLDIVELQKRNIESNNQTFEIKINNKL